MRKRIVKSVVEELEKEVRSEARHKVLGLYRKRDGARRLHEHGVLARFRYNDLKEAARAVDAGPMQIQWWEGAWPSSAEAVPQSATGDSRSPEAS